MMSMTFETEAELPITFMAFGHTTSALLYDLFEFEIEVELSGGFDGIGWYEYGDGRFFDKGEFGWDDCEMLSCAVLDDRVFGSEDQEIAIGENWVECHEDEVFQRAYDTEVGVE